MIKHSRHNEKYYIACSRLSIKEDAESQCTCPNSQKVTCLSQWLWESDLHPLPFAHFPTISADVTEGRSTPSALKSSVYRGGFLDPWEATCNQWWSLTVSDPKYLTKYWKITCMERRKIKGEGCKRSPSRLYSTATRAIC